MTTVNSRDGQRIPPKMGVDAYKTYQIIAPLRTHWRDATCEEAGCVHNAFGWRTIVDESTDLGQQQAHYIRKESRRKYVEEKQPDGLTAFTFEAGQPCFQPHKLRVERPENFLVRAGDWRGNPTRQQRLHTRAEFWVEDFAEHQDKIATQLERG